MTGFLSIKPSTVALNCGCTGCNDAAYIGGVTYPDPAGGCGTSEPTGGTGNCSVLSKSKVIAIPAGCTVNVTGCVGDRVNCSGGSAGAGLDGGDSYSMVGSGGALNGNSGVVTGASNTTICRSITQVGGQVQFNLTANRVSEMLTYTISYSGPACMPGPLPIQLVYLTLEKEDEALQLNWATASEHNSRNFDIEYSYDAYSFKKYVSVEAAGESRILKSYTSLLPDTFKTDVIYLRLKSNDKNGKYDYSPVIFWEDNPADNFILSPNPTPSGDILVRSIEKIKPGTTAQLLDPAGNLLLELNIENNSTLLDLKPFSKGVYILRLNSNGRLVHKKIVYN